MALHSMGYICSSVGASFYPQGLTLVCNCFQLTGPGSRRRERRYTKVGPEVETTRL